MLLEIFLVYFLGKRGKVVLMALFPNLFVEIEDTVIDVDGIIWGGMLFLYLGYPYFRWDFN